MEVLERLARAGIVPVVVLDDPKDAVPTAKALLAGGIDVMEITFRTPAAAESIQTVSQNCPEMCVGAGTVVTLDQCKRAMGMGAKFIVAPGFDEAVVRMCIASHIAVTPGCVTPTEIMAAMKFGLRIVKFFPANVYGGMSALKALSGPFEGIRFIPTGGVNTQNLSEYISAPCVHAVGGSWICAKKDIAAGHFDKITALCKEARQTALGFEVAHIGINCDDEAASADICNALEKAFGFATKKGNSSNFATDGIEVMKSKYLGTNGHIAIRTNNIDMAINVLEKNGLHVDLETAKYKSGRMAAVYVKEEFGGFAMHLLQR